MNIKQFIEKICKDNNTSKKRLAEAIGTTSGGMYNLEHAKGINLKTLTKICNYFDYEIVIRPRSSVNRAERTITLEAEID